jgi:polyhydroxyalkanoate synthesis regulator phasin
MRWQSFLKFISLIAAINIFAGTMSILAEDSNALLDLLVRKKLITAKEAAEVRAELSKEEKVKETSAEKWKISTPITELELYGDARVRYEIRNGDTVTNDTQQRNRERYRMRLGLRGTLADDWFFGVRLETSTSARSTNVTFGDDTSGNGPFVKNSDGVYVGQAYLGYKGFKDITLTAGRMPNPLVSTFLVWDPDINPEGLAEQWKHTFTFGGAATESATESYTKDGMALPKEKKSESQALKIDIFITLAQFVYDDANPENPIGAAPARIPNTDAFLLAWQVGAKFTFPNKLYAQIAPAIYNYTGAGDTFNTTFSGDSGGNQTGVNNLLVFDLPMEVGWKLGEIPMRFFADFAVNLEADDRAAAASHPGKGDQRYAYQVGASIGQLKKKREWQLNVFWQHQEQFSLDPNLIDTEFFDTKLNLEGVGVTFGYMLSDAVWVQLLYAYAWRADSALGTGGGGDIAINPLEDYQLFQADLNVRF